MAGPIKLTEVDFEQIKENLINYLRSTKQFTDFDFAGSNLQVILNLIAYQAQLNSYTTNMVANESFLASSTIRTNVVENANMLGYVPTSARCASAVVDVEFRLDKEKYPQGYPTYIEIQPGTVLNAGNGQDTYTFNVVDPVIAGVISASGIVRFNNLQTYEGFVVEETFTVDESNFTQRFYLKNMNVDTTTLRVEVQEVGTEKIYRSYEQANNLVKLTMESRAYWIEETRDGYYEIRFGDGYFGRKLKSGAKIKCTYIVTTGELANGIQNKSNYSFIGKLIDSYGTAVRENANILTASMNSTGAQPEDVSSIKLRAPRSYEAQNRCVTEDDYETIIRQIFPAVEDIYVFGGETLDEPQYGRIYVSIKPTTGDKISQITKNYIKKSLDPYRIASLDIRFIDPDVVNVELVSTVYYDDRKTNKDTTGIIAAVESALTQYNDSSVVSKFGGTVRFSTMVAIIDDADHSITRNNTAFRLRKDVEPIINTYASYEVCFSNPLLKDCDGPVLSSTGFRMEVNGIFDEKVYYMEDDSNGNVRVFYITENNRKVITNNYFGSINYETGDLLIGYDDPIKIVNVTSDSELIELRVIPRNQDVVARESVFLKLDIAQSSIGAVADNNIAR